MNTAETSSASTDANEDLPQLVLRDVCDAASRLRGAVRRTPCRESPVLGVEAGVRLFLKHDHAQLTGSFKERGAANALACLPPRMRRRGVVAASAGNHALGLARHGARLGIPVTIVMPDGASRVKAQRCRELGAEVLTRGRSFDEADHDARARASREGRTYVHPFDDVQVMAGQGTMGLEIIEQVPEVEAVLVPVGGGGLLAGVCAAIKSLRPEVKVIAVEPAAAASYAKALAAGRPVRTTLQPTLADGLAVAQVGRSAFSISRDLVDSVVTVTEDEIAYAMLRLFETARLSIEGAGAVALAALLAGKVPEVSGLRVVVPVCGANVDAATFARALQMAAEPLAS